jgi:hypothetical protein
MGKTQRRAHAQTSTSTSTAGPTPTQCVSNQSVASQLRTAQTQSTQPSILDAVPGMCTPQPKATVRPLPQLRAARPQSGTGDSNGMTANDALTMKNGAKALTTAKKVQTLSTVARSGQQLRQAAGAGVDASAPVLQSKPAPVSTKPAPVTAPKPTASMPRPKGAALGNYVDDINFHMARNQSEIDALKAQRKAKVPTPKSTAPKPSATAPNKAPGSSGWSKLGKLGGGGLNVVGGVLSGIGLYNDVKNINKAGSCDPKHGSGVVNNSLGLASSGLGLGALATGSVPAAGMTLGAQALTAGGMSGVLGAGALGMTVGTLGDQWSKDNGTGSNFAKFMGQSDTSADGKKKSISDVAGDTGYNTSEWLKKKGVNDTLAMVGGGAATLGASALGAVQSVASFGASALSWMFGGSKKK